MAYTKHICFQLSSHVINVKDAREFSKDQDPIHGVVRGENRKLKAGMYTIQIPNL